VSDDEAEIRLTLRALPGPWGPVAVRLRFLLKYALRTCGLKAVSVEELAPPATMMMQDATRADKPPRAGLATGTRPG
jgi:hypothetical protein